MPVKGRVTLDGGSWPQTGYITFVPQEKDASYPSASTQFDKEGNFSVIGGYGGAEGLHPGSYWISVDCPEDPGEMPLPGKVAESKNFVPPKYRRPESSGFNLDVSAGEGTLEKTFDVKTSG